jgi:hypothetical protein
MAENPPCSIVLPEHFLEVPQIFAPLFFDVLDVVERYLFGYSANHLSLFHREFGRTRDA